MKEEVVNEFNSPKSLTPLSAAYVLGNKPFRKEPKVIAGKWVIYLEQRPFEKGRSTILISQLGSFKKEIQELTPFPKNIKTRIHGYGGGAFSVKAIGDELWIVWIDDADGCVWFQVWTGILIAHTQECSRLNPKHQPLCLSISGKDSFANGVIDIKRKRWIGVMESNKGDLLVSLSLELENQKPRILYKAKDFLAYPALAPLGDQIAWVEWQYPSMPWDESSLYWSKLEKNGGLQKSFHIAGNHFNEIDNKSVFQPFWMDGGELVVSEDSNGWWNLILIGPSINPKKLTWKRLWPMKSESALPQWVHGMSTTSSSGKTIISANCINSVWRLSLLSLDGSISHLSQPFDDLSGVDADSGKAVCIASNSHLEPAILEVDLKTSNWEYYSSSQLLHSSKKISEPQLFSFKGFQEKSTYSWYYPPNQIIFEPCPLLVKLHSGPTGMASKGLNLAIQFWTSRGWAVVDVNYGGSTGFGREYRDRIKNNWGKVDIYDCILAVESLIDSGKVDPNKIAIEGGSAGGFTTLACLCHSDIFKVASCRYPVSDLNLMLKQTHRFEAGYLNYLLGKSQENEKLYIDRSPINNLKNIHCPIIFFQGLKDKVVDPYQTEKIYSLLKKTNKDVELFTFADEGHGFKTESVKIKVLEKTEEFFNKHIFE